MNRRTTTRHAGADRFEYRVRWRSHEDKINGVSKKHRLRYEKRETEIAARSVATFLDSQMEIFAGATLHRVTGCRWCAGVVVPPSEITIHRRPVGEWEKVRP